MNRTAEFILGLLGGIVGLFFSIGLTILGGLLTDFEMIMMVIGLLSVVFSILGIVGSIIVKSKPKKGGILMLISAVGGSVCLIQLFAMSWLFLLIAGLMGIFRKGKTEKAIPR